MAQDKITIDGKEIRQPDYGLGYDFETTYASDTTRSQSGTLKNNRMFTVESLSYSAKGLTRSEMSNILQLVMKGSHFSLHYYSAYYGTWRTAPFYVGKGSLQIGRLVENKEIFESLSFNMIGVNPV